MNKSTIFVGLLAVAALFAAGGSAFFTYMKTKPRAAVEDLEKFDLTSVAGYAPNEEKGDVAVELKHELKGGNTTLVWEMAKNKPSGDRQEFDGTWDALTGGLVYNAKEKTIKAVQVIIAVDSVVGYGVAHPAPPDLTETLRGNTPGMPAWFDIESHPKAEFKSDSILAKKDVPADVEVFENAPEGWTHLIRGTFQLNGESIELDIPAVVEFVGDKDVTVSMAWQIDRTDFNVSGKMVGGWVVEDIANLSASVSSSPKGDAVLAAIRQLGVDISGNKTEIEALRKLKNRIEELESQLAKLKTEGVKTTGTGNTPAVDISKLDKTVKASVKYPSKDPIEFEMVLVPGDAKAGIAPFYMGKTEVSWAMFYDWAYGADIDADTYASLQKKYLRPSPLYEDCEQLKLGLQNRPALSMSRKTAEAFAKWVSEQTGKSFRIPTAKEWDHALKLGGGIPESQDDLLKQAILEENAKEQEDPPFLMLTSEVGTTEPNKLGIHDMLGNAAEWVVDTGAERVVRGGHFQLPADELTADWKAVEDQAIWNETYPQLPLSEFWYRDHYYQGIRLVCDVE